MILKTFTLKQTKIALIYSMTFLTALKRILSHWNKILKIKNNNYSTNFKEIFLRKNILANFNRFSKK